MTTRDRILIVLLWYLVFAWGSWFGGTVYQMLVVVPLWSAAPPDSVVAFFQGTDYNRTIFHFFGPPFMAARVLPAIVALALAWHRPKHRFALGTAVVCMIAAVVFTLAYVYPINEVLFQQAGGGRPPAEIANMVDTWVLADRVRFVVGATAFVMLLRAFRLPLPPRYGW
ncbi:MAG: DUF1772 domain-containing protein [Gammaproteobacteria bacterium]|nr:DUF1772 domain-containing protein [Gammaproteobacteria bacterium]MDH4255115.1 DUF1772 domain-containing protein [Gammaproteobacteria bacterium]MDH5310816.1 DUF1772 domain-containing protein [Gammaproteobacteria bacterium]